MVAFFAGAAFLVAFFAGAAFFAFLAGAAFFLPETIALNSAPARNFGTEVALIFTVAPVCGLRPVRAGRSFFSKLPKPVMDTLSPEATALTISSKTASTASEAAFLLPSRRAATASISSALFTFFPLHGHVKAARLCDLWAKPMPNFHGQQARHAKSKGMICRGIY